MARFVPVLARAAVGSVVLMMVGSSITAGLSVAHAGSAVLAGDHSKASLTRLAQADGAGQPLTPTVDRLSAMVRERASLVGTDATVRTAIEALAASLGGGCRQTRAARPGIAVLGFPNTNDVGLSNTEASALRNEVKDAVSRLDDLLVLVPIDDSASTHDVLETIRVTGSAEARAEARRALDRDLQGAVDVVIHFSKVVTTFDESNFQVNVIARDGGCAQSRTVPVAPERLVSGDLRVIIEEAARAASRAPLIRAMGSGDALVVIPPQVEGRLQSSVWADAFADALAEKLRPLLTATNRQARADLIGAYGKLPKAEATRYLWLQPRFARERGSIEFSLHLFPTEGDRNEIIRFAVTEDVILANAEKQPTLEVTAAREPFIKEREEVDYFITSRSRLSLFCHFVGSNGFSSLITPSSRTMDLMFVSGALVPNELLDRETLFELSDRRFPKRRSAAHVEMVECIGVPPLSPETRQKLAAITQDWLHLARTGGGIHPTGDVRALFTAFPYFHRSWVARALGHIVETTRVPDQERAAHLSPPLR